MIPSIRDWFDRARCENLLNDDLEESRMLFSLKRKTSDEPDHEGSCPGRAVNTDRDFEEGYRRIFQDYFVDYPIYSSKLFRRRFRMRRELFLRIINGVKAQDPWFEQKIDALGKKGLYPLQKVVAAIRLLAYGCSCNIIGDYIQISESSASDCLQHFCAAIEAHFGPEYLRSPTEEDLKRILIGNAACGFLGMIGSIDCYNWK
nr:uncharacterized protein LOC112289904 [Physcomitrium patens]|eukprot:XP_024391393.1 uncharacterized protein LOC112289904 [Physcomitrella patens]